MNCFSFHLSCCVGLMYINIMNHSRYSVNPDGSALRFQGWYCTCAGIWSLGINPHVCRAGGAAGGPEVPRAATPSERFPTTVWPDEHMARHIPRQGRGTGRTTAGQGSVRAATPDQAPLRHTRTPTRRMRHIPCARAGPKDGPPGHKRRSAIPVQGTLGSGGLEIWNGADIPHVLNDTTPDVSKGGCAAKTGAPEEQAGAPHTHVPRPHATPTPQTDGGLRLMWYCGQRPGPCHIVRGLCAYHGEHAPAMLRPRAATQYGGMRRGRLRPSPPGPEGRQPTPAHRPPPCVPAAAPDITSVCVHTGMPGRKRPHQTIPRYLP